MATNLTPWNGLDVEKLKVWVHHILPLVYDDSLSYYEVLAKVGAKMNEVIEGLNANNEQVEKVTGFTIEQVKNLTLAFNNFQQSMLTRQENFENTLHQDVNTWETQIEGDIASWKAETEEAFENQYQDFLTKYQKQFGVSQDFGNSTEDTLSQNFLTENFLAYHNEPIPDTFKPMSDDKPENIKLGVYWVKNQSGDVDNGLPTEFANRAAFLLVLPSSRYLLYTQDFSIVYSGAQGGEWYKINVGAPKEEFGDSTSALLSQNFLTENFLAYHNEPIPDTFKPMSDDKPENIKLGVYWVKNQSGDVDNGLPTEFANRAAFLLVLPSSRYLLYTQDFSIVYSGAQGGEWYKINVGAPKEEFGDSTSALLSQNFLTENFLAYHNEPIPDTFKPMSDDKPENIKLGVYWVKNQSGDVDNGLPTEFANRAAFLLVLPSSRYLLYTQDFLSIYTGSQGGNWAKIEQSKNSINLAVIGDSISADEVAYGNYNWTAFINKTLYVNKLQNLAKSTATLSSYDASVNPHMCDMVDSIDDDIDVIVSFGGTNDWGVLRNYIELGEENSNDKNTVYGALNYIADKCINNHPKACVIFVTPLIRKDYKTVGGNFTFENVVEAVRKVAEKNNFMLIDLFKYGNFNVTNPTKCKNCTRDNRETEGDGLHPNAYWAENVVCTMICNKIKEIFQHHNAY